MKKSILRIGDHQEQTFPFPFTFSTFVSLSYRFPRSRRGNIQELFPVTETEDTGIPCVNPRHDNTLVSFLTTPILTNNFLFNAAVRSAPLHEIAITFQPRARLQFHADIHRNNRQLFTLLVLSVKAPSLRRLLIDWSLVSFQTRPPSTFKGGLTTGRECRPLKIYNE